MSDPRPSDPRPSDPHADDRYAAGMAVRREVLGDAHVDRAEAAKTPFTTDFQTYITRCAWGEVWTRPGLDRRTRSVITLTALIAGGHWEELQMHLRAAKRNGLSEPEIGEVILQTAVYLGVPAANHAFAIAAATFAEDAGPGIPGADAGASSPDPSPGNPASGGAADTTPDSRGTNADAHSGTTPGGPNPTSETAATDHNEQPAHPTGTSSGTPARPTARPEGN